jgi:hypothetical protein
MSEQNQPPQPPQPPQPHSQQRIQMNIINDADYIFGLTNRQLFIIKDVISEVNLSRKVSDVIFKEFGFSNEIEIPIDDNIQEIKLKGSTVIQISQIFDGVAYRIAKVIMPQFEQQVFLQLKKYQEEETKKNISNIVNIPVKTKEQKTEQEEQKME